VQLIELHNARDPIDRAGLHKLLDQLLDLRARTDPAVCKDPVSVSLKEPPGETVIIDGEEGTVTYRSGKDECAGWAVFVATHLFASVAGWAINHKIGRALADIEVDQNSHELERIGQEAAAPGGGGRLDDPTAARKALLEALHGCSLPWSIRVDLREGIEALEFGEVHPLLKPVTTGRHGKAYTLAQGRMKAVEYANFLHGKGIPLIRAETNVAKALGVEQTTLKSWYTRDLPRALGAEEVSKRVSEARSAGQFIETVRHDKERREMYASKKWAGTKECWLLMTAESWEKFDLGELKADIRQATCWT
jgi:hypothetical protein